MRFLNAIMVSCFKRSNDKSADGYFCFTLEHGGSRQALLVRLMRRTLSSAQCLAGGPFEFFQGHARRPCELMQRGVEPPFVRCLKIDSELFHHLGALTNAVASQHRLTRLYGLMERMAPCSAWPSKFGSIELKTLR
jgi:hypothetical protein